jgi:intraflagellar transport protein 140
MCLDKDAPDVLEEIADSVQPGADPAILERCAGVLADNGQFQRAAYFLALAGRFGQARELCQERKLKLPHQVIEALAQMKADPDTTTQIAALCEQQEAWLSAAQLYIAVGDYLAAMRNIIAQGDTDKVIRLAGLLKRKDAFLGAADYLASTRPREGQPLFKTTIQLYQRAGAFERIAEFLVATAQSEIDEDQNYEKAAAMLRRAHQTMARTEMTRDRERLVEQVLQKIRWIEMYLEATRCVKTDPLRMQSICNELLQTRCIEKCLRIEDVYMLLVQYAIAKENWVVAHRILDNMRMNGIDLKYVMEEEEIAKIFKAAGQVYVPKEEPVEDGVSEIPDDVVDMIADDF